MKINTKALLALGLVTIMLGSSLPANADHEPPLVIGAFERFGFEDDLTENDVEPTARGLKLDTPGLADELRVHLSFLQEELGDFAADQAFEVSGGQVVLPGRDTEFVSFHPTEDRQFTQGSKRSLEFSERPMWVSVEETTDGGFVLDMDDGDTTGQDLYISKEWLRSQGMHRPIATHEDGYSLTVRDSDDHQSFIVEVPHFTQVFLTPADIDVKGRQGGAPFVHTGLITWDDVAMRLEIDVGLKFSDYELLVEKDWFDLNMPHPALFDYEWELENVSGSIYYVVEVSAPATPEVVTFQEFSPTLGPVFSQGALSSISFDLPFSFDVGLFSSSVNITVLSNAPVPLDIQATANASWLKQLGLSKPGVRTSFGLEYTQTIVEFEWFIFSVPVNATFAAIEDLQFPAVASLDVIGSVIELTEPGDQCKALYQEETGEEPGAIHEIYHADDDWGTRGLFAYEASLCFEWDLHDPIAELFHIWHFILMLDENYQPMDMPCAVANDVPAASNFGAFICAWPDPENFPAAKFYYEFALSSEWDIVDDVVKAGTDCAIGAVLQSVPVLNILADLLTGGYDCQDASQVFYGNPGEVRQRFKDYGFVDGFFGVVGVDLQDPQDSRRDTWTLLEHLVTRDDSWDGYQDIYWTLHNVQLDPVPRLDYDTEGSVVHGASFDSDQMECFFGPGGGTCESRRSSFSGSANGNEHTKKITIRSGGIDRLDWEVPETPCLVIGKIMTTVGQNPYELSIGNLFEIDPMERCYGLWALPIENAEGNVDSDADWWAFEVLNTSIPASAFTALNGSITLNDVVAQDGNLTRAIMVELLNDMEFVEGLTEVQFDFAGAPPVLQDCNVHEFEHVTTYTATATARTIIGDELMSPADVEPLSICFDSLPGILTGWNGN